MKKFKRAIVALLPLFIFEVSYADVIIKSPEGGAVTFSQEKKGDHYDNGAWGKIIFSNQDYSADLSRSDRYYSEDGSSRTSPSGKYLIVNSVSGGYVDLGDGTSKYTDRAYCSVVDMTNGCIVSDWDGEACGYTWVKNQDVLASSNENEAATFDFNSMRPSMNEAQNLFSTIDSFGANNLARCDMPKKENINSYQLLAKENAGVRKTTNSKIIAYLDSVAIDAVVKSKSILFTTPDNNGLTKAYLVSGDKVKIIQNSSDNIWVNIGYINAKGTPLIAWIKADTINK